MTTEDLSKETEKALEDIQKFMDGYAPLREKLYKFTEKYQNGILDAPGTLPLVAGSACSIMAGMGILVASTTTAFAGAAIAPLALPFFAVAGAAQLAAGLNYLTGKIINPIAKHLSRKDFEPEKVSNRLGQLIEARIEMNANIPDNEKRTAIKKMTDNIMGSCKAMFTDDGPFATYVSSIGEAPLKKLEGGLDGIVEQSDKRAGQRFDTWFNTFKEAHAAEQAAKEAENNVARTSSLGMGR
ncbi:hypothetical protein [Aeromonas veronii]|uniref:Uncharacterized protein n=1 Tax=Aeromonas veronii TaxID=654 RepID=A0A4S5CGF8_AERVE|nr:hypothetical protein [Aeromonas veronii]THJ44944.1 hypothetical protein E8Q35_12200 [Aeromonas veronii]